jgi:2'-5' RNA ligase
MEPKENLTRCFIALELPRTAVNEIKRIQGLVKKQSLITGKFTEIENLHLTLKFLGEIEEIKIDEVKKRLKEIKLKKFKARLDEVGVFSSRYRDYIRVLWVKLGGKGVFELQKEIDEKLKSLFGKEIRFMSHITIARIKDVSDKKEFLSYVKAIKVPEIEFGVDEFILNKSELKEEGPVYTNIEAYKLE